jgi:hypothetical protein
MATYAGRAGWRSLPWSDSREGDTRGLLAELRRRPLWLAVGVLVAAAAAASQFATIGLLPPSVKFESIAHSIANTQLVVGQSSSLSLGQGPAAPDPFERAFPTRAIALADMVASPEISGYIARAASLPASQIAVDAPLWTQLPRDQQWATGEKRASQIVVEKDPYRITLNNAAAGPVIDVTAQAPTSGAAVRLAQAVSVGLNTYLSSLQNATRTPAYARYDVSQSIPVTVTPARTSGLANVAIFTFIAIFVLWCGVLLAVSGVVRDVRFAKHRLKVPGPTERSSPSHDGSWEPGRVTTPNG